MDILDTLLVQLATQAKQRPDLLSANAGGPSFGSPDYRAPGDQRAYTFAGRVGRGGESLRDMMARMPQESPDAEGFQSVMRLLAPAGVSQAIVAPARNAQQRAVQEAIKTSAPGLWQKLVDDPRTITTRVTTPSRGAYGSYHPDTDVIKVSPSFMPYYTQNLPASLADVSVHEATHAVIEPRLSKLSPHHALETAQQIGELIRGSNVSDDVQRYIGDAEAAQIPAKYTRLPLLQEIADTQARLAYNESLAHMNELAGRTTDPLLRNLATALGLR